MPLPSRPNAVALTRIPITRVTTLRPIGPRRRAMGPAGTERQPHHQRRPRAHRGNDHQIAQARVGRRLHHDGRDRARADGAGNRQRHDRERLPLFFRDFIGRHVLGRRQLQLLHRHHADAVQKKDQTAGRLQHRHADAEDLQERTPDPRAGEQDDENREGALIRHAPLDVAREAPGHRREQYRGADGIHDRKQGRREQYDRLKMHAAKYASIQTGRCGAIADWRLAIAD
jgi:hypothetical protein